VKLVRIGKVVRAIGLEGRVGVAGSDGALGELERVALRLGDGAPQQRTVVDARPQGKLWAMLLEGVSDRDAAEALVGSEVLADRDELGEPEGGLHYWGDLEGLAVETVAGEAVGRVTGLLETGAADVLVVTTDGGREVLIPLAPYVKVEREAGRVLVDPPDGLLDLEAHGREENGREENGREDNGREEKGGPQRGE
jgi:16S rRNA processing protein RimM